MRAGARGRVAPRLALGVLVAGHLLAWGAVFRFHLVQGDDFLNAAMSGQPYGRTTLGRWWESYVHDYTQVNGRLADGAVRALLAPGPQVWPVAGPILLTAVVLLLVAWGMAGSRRPDTPGGAGPWLAVVLTLAAGSAVPLALATDIALAGDAIFWMSSAVGYELSTAVAFAAGLVLLRVAQGRPLPRAVRAAGPVLILFAHLLHEVSSFAVLALVVATWLLGEPGVRGGYLRLCTAVSLVGFALQAGSPGFRARFLSFTPGPQQASFPSRLLAMTANGNQTLLDAAWPVLLGAAALLSLAVWWPPGRPAETLVRGRRLVASAVATLAALGGAVAGTVIHAARADGPWARYVVGLPFTGAGRAYAVGSVVATLVLVGGLVGLALVLRPRVGPGPGLVLAATLGAVVIPWTLGLLTVRAFLPTLLWLWAVCLVGAGAVWDLGRPASSSVRVGRAIVATAAVAALAAATPAALQAYRAMRANATVWAATQAQLDAAVAAGSGDVRLPSAFPYPAYLYGSAYDRRRYEADMRTYYGLPPGVRLRWPGDP